MADDENKVGGQPAAGQQAPTVDRSTVVGLADDWRAYGLPGPVGMPEERLRAQVELEYRAQCCDPAAIDQLVRRFRYLTCCVSAYIALRIEAGDPDQLTRQLIGRYLDAINLEKDPK